MGKIEEKEFIQNVFEFDDIKDNVIGVLNTKDYFRLEDKSRNSVMQEAVYRAYFVPET